MAKSAMVAIYVNLVRKGVKKIEEVPKVLRKDVEKELKAGE